MGFIGYKLVYAYNIGELWSNNQTELSIKSGLLVLTVLVLMPLNWYFEAQKWKIIFGKHEPVTNRKAYKSILAGITLGIITPNQIGDMAGKSLYLESFSKLKGIAANFIGGIAQIVCTFILGSYALLSLFCHLTPLSFAITLLLFVALTIVNIACIYGFIRIRKLNIFKRWVGFREYLPVITNYSSNELIKLLVYSSLRFLIFSFQYFLLLHLFSIQLSIPQWFMSVFSLYLVQILSPSFILIQVGVRGALALYFIGFFATNTIAILQASYSLWIINAMLPGLIGLFLLLTFKRKPTK